MASFLAVRRQDIEDLTGRFLTARVDAKSLVRKSLSSMVVDEED
jgi:hypothetical protein